MPTISTFYGIIIRMFYDEHAPPHFHAQYGEFKAVIAIQTLEPMEGKLPRRALELILDWAELHQAELMENWNLCQKHMQPFHIDPLR
jgi:hypothetical protein